MNAKQFAAQMKAEIEDLKQKGVASLYVDNLITYLDNVQDAPSAEPSTAELERYKADLSRHIEVEKHNFNSDLEMFKSVISAGQNAIRTMVIINGGASVAMLAFLGHLATMRSPSIPTYADSLLPFVIGTLLAGLTSGGTYLCQWLYAGESKGAQKAGFAANVFVILCGISSFAGFGWGAWNAYDAFKTAPPKPLAPIASTVVPGCR